MGGGRTMGQPDKLSQSQILSAVGQGLQVYFWCGNELVKSPEKATFANDKQLQQFATMAVA